MIREIEVKMGIGETPRRGGAARGAPLVNTDTIVESTPTENTPEEVVKLRKVTSSHKKTGESLKCNVGTFITAAGVENCLFFTPTLANKDGKPPDPDRAQACWRKMELMVVKEWPNGGVRVMERGGETLRLHFHVLLDVAEDVRTGYDFNASRAAQKANRRAKWELHFSANAALKRIEAKLRRMALRAGFGKIFHCEPIRSKVEAVREYFSKYVCKQIGQRVMADKGRRLVGYFGKGAERRSMPSANCFAFGGDLVQNRGTEWERPDYRNAWAWLWRKKLGQWMRKNRIKDEDEAREVLGPKGVWRNRETILEEILDVTYPYAWVALLDNRMTPDEYDEMPLGMWTRNVTFKTVKVCTPEPKQGPGGMVHYRNEWISSAAVIEYFNTAFGKVKPTAPPVPKYKDGPGKTVTVMKDGSVIKGAFALAE